MRMTLAVARALCRAKALSSSPIVPWYSLDLIIALSLGPIAFAAVWRQYLSMPFLICIIERNRISRGIDLSRKTDYSKSRSVNQLLL